jgi:hypothetical protein
LILTALEAGGKIYICPHRTEGAGELELPVRTE